MRFQRKKDAKGIVAITVMAILLSLMIMLAAFTVFISYRIELIKREITEIQVDYCALTGITRMRHTSWYDHSPIFTNPIGSMSFTLPYNDGANTTCCDIDVYRDGGGDPSIVSYHIVSTASIGDVSATYNVLSGDPNMTLDLFDEMYWGYAGVYESHVPIIEWERE